MIDWKPENIEIDIYAEENLNIYFRQIKQVLDNNQITVSRQEAVFQDLKELLQEYIEKKNIQKITYAVSLKLLELLGPPAEFAELAEEFSPPEIKAFEINGIPSDNTAIKEKESLPEIKTLKGELNSQKLEIPAWPKGFKRPARVQRLQRAENVHVHTQKINVIETLLVHLLTLVLFPPRLIKALIKGILLFPNRFIRNQWTQKHILFLSLILPFCCAVFINGLLSAYYYGHSWNEQAISAWLPGTLIFCLVSALGIYYVFSRKKANLSDFFLSGVLYCLFGISLLGILSLEVSSYAWFASIAYITGLLSLWSPIIFFLLFILYQLLWSYRRKTLVTTNLPSQSQVHVKVHTLLLFFECILLLFIHQWASIGYLAALMEIVRIIIVFVIALQSIYIGFICVEPTLSSYFHDLNLHLREYFGIKKRSFREYFSLEPLQPVEVTEKAKSPDIKSKLPTDPNISENVSCPSCDRPNELDWKFCPHCGFRTVPSIKKPYQQRRGRVEWIRSHSLFLVLLIPTYIVILAIVDILVTLLFWHASAPYRIDDFIALFSSAGLANMFLFGAVITFVVVSTLGIFLAFFNKKANASNFFLVGILCCLLGINLFGLRYYLIYSFVWHASVDYSATSVLIVFTFLSPFLLLCYYLLGSYRREIMQVTNLSYKSRFITVVISTVLFIQGLALFSEINFYDPDSIIRFISYTSLLLGLLGIFCIIFALLATRRSLNQQSLDPHEEYIELLEGTSSIEPEIQPLKNLEFSGNSIKCPYCEQTIEASTIFCPYCAFEVISFKEPKRWTQWFKTHKLFLALLLSVQTLMFASVSLLYNVYVSIFFSYASGYIALLFWIAGFIGIIFISGVRVFKFFSKKKSNTLDFFLSGVLYTLFGIHMSIFGITIVFSAFDYGSSIFLLFILSLSTPFAILIANQLFKLFQRDRMATMNLSRKHRLIIGGGNLLILLLGISIVFFVLIGPISIIVGIQQILVRPSDNSYHQSTSFELPTQLRTSVSQNE